MFKKFLTFAVLILVSINLCGCVALLAGGVAGGAGTAVWLSGKLTQNLNSSFENVNKAARQALNVRGLSISSKENINKGIVQLRSYDTNGEKIWIDIFRIDSASSQIQLRVGTFFSNKEASHTLLKLIEHNLR